jgi:KaiC/GvpD/RAD55 family RecA-like ATPase
MKINMLPNQRVLVCGKTGCGKSYFVLHALVPFFRYYVVYDYKCEIDLPGAVIFNRVEDFYRNPGQAKIIYRQRQREETPHGISLPT